MSGDAPFTYRDVALILALVDGPQGGRLTLARDGMEIRVEKEVRVEKAPRGPAPGTPPEAP